ncbi:TIGR01777 family oxidoreductase [Saccharopolyspora sp. NPDC050389]|uniref:TIGR01777 family oxidoreductase n=1 Tax=Saccharopolyspora sp. NPDC050389 TaxID=3155516 RepID=UPI0033DCC191
MLVVMAGASGLIGTALRRSLESDGHTVRRLVRRQPASPDEVRWDPVAEPSSAWVAGAEVIVNLAGAPLGGQRWTRGYKSLLLRSRIDSAHMLAVAAAAAHRPPRVMISASGIRFYGVDRGDEVLGESASGVADGFLPTVTRAWEEATSPASAAGIAVCHLRLGLVVSRYGGFLPRLLPMFRVGLGATLGSGSEFWSYVSLADAVRAIRFLMARPGAEGPYNIAVPNPIRSRAFTHALASAIGKQALLRVPTGLLRVAMGQVGPEVLGSLRVVPTRLTEAGFESWHPDIASVLDDALHH